MMKQHDRSGDARVVEKVKQYEIDTLGAPFKVTLYNSVTLGIDPKTGKEKINVPDLVGLINSVVRARVSHPRKLNGDELRFVRNAVGVKANLLAEFLEMSPEHLSRCESGAKVMSTMSEKVFRLFAFLATFFADPEEMLLRAMSDEEIEGAMDKRVKKPNEVGKKFTQHFLSMKIQSVFDPDEELHFKFTRCDEEDDELEGSSEDSLEWINEKREPVAACC